MSEADPVPEKISRVTVPALDAILGVPIKILDDGFIRVVDYMGTDESIVQAARVSYGKGTKQVSQDRGLIRYLLRHDHTTPFEMCEIKLHIRIPMDAWRQWIRHRTANVNEYSTRYSVAIDAAQKTLPSQWRRQDAMNKQSSSGYLEEATGKTLTKKEEEFQLAARALYNERLELGVSREQARKDLPLSTYTEAYWKVDLHNLLHFLRLRMDWHAQEEIRNYAHAIGHQIVAKWCPLTWDAFQDYKVQATSLTRVEGLIISAIANGKPAEAMNVAKAEGLLDKDETGALKRNRERQDVEAKLQKLKISIPWA